MFDFKCMSMYLTLTSWLVERNERKGEKWKGGREREKMRKKDVNLNFIVWFDMKLISSLLISFFSSLFSFHFFKSNMSLKFITKVHNTYKDKHVKYQISNEWFIKKKTRYHLHLVIEKKSCYLDIYIQTSLNFS